MPNLIEVQKRSYERFLQMHRAPADRDRGGLAVGVQVDLPDPGLPPDVLPGVRRLHDRQLGVQVRRGRRDRASAKRMRALRAEADRAGRPGRRGPLRRLRQSHPGDHSRVRAVRRSGRLEVQVRRGRVPGAGADLHRAAQGHDPARRVRQGSRDRGEKHQGHQGAGGLLRRDPDAHRERDLHHQRHRARHRQPAAPQPRGLLPVRSVEDRVHGEGHPVPRIVGRVRVRPEEHPLRAHRPEAKVPGDRVPARARVRGRRRHPARVLHRCDGEDRGREVPGEGGRRQRRQEGPAVGRAPQERRRDPEERPPRAAGAARRSEEGSDRVDSDRGDRDGRRPHDP